MQITESRANDILHWLDDEAGNHALLFEKMTLHRDAAALIRQLQVEAKDAEIEELRADSADYMRIANTEATRAERLAEALRYAEAFISVAVPQLARDRDEAVNEVLPAIRAALHPTAAQEDAQ